MFFFRDWQQILLLFFGLMSFLACVVDSEFERFEFIGNLPPTQSHHIIYANFWVNAVNGNMFFIITTNSRRLFCRFKRLLLNGMTQKKVLLLFKKTKEISLKTTRTSNRRTNLRAHPRTHNLEIRTHEPMNPGAKLWHNSAIHLGGLPYCYLQHTTHRDIEQRGSAEALQISINYHTTSRIIKWKHHVGESPRPIRKQRSS